MQASIHFIWFLVVLGCSSALDFSAECESNAACASLGEGLICVEGQCTLDPDYTPDVTTLRDAGQQNDAGVMGLSALINRGCVALGPASMAPGEHRLIAALVPMADNTLDPKILRAMALAVEAINGANGVTDQPLSIIACPENPTDPDATVALIQRMAGIATEPVLIGPTATELSLPVFTRGAQAYGLLNLSMAPPNVEAGTPPDPLHWHNRASAKVSAEAAAAVALTEPDAQITVLYRDDPWGLALADVVRAKICQAGDCSTLKLVGFPTFSPAISAVAATLAGDAPDLVITVARSADFVALNAALADVGITRTLAIEGPHTANDMRAFLALDSEGVSRLPDWRRGLRTALLCSSATVYRADKGPSWAEWSAEFGEGPTANAARYADAVFLVSYAIVAAAATGNEVTADRIAQGLERLMEGSPISIGAEDWRRGVNLLQSGNIDLSGASSGLWFTDQTVRSAVQMAWFDEDGAGIHAGHEILDDRGRFTPPMARMPCE